MSFVWVLCCKSCHVTFPPSEEEWDEEITCPYCKTIDFIEHEEYDGPVKPFLQIVREPPKAS